MYFPPVCSMGCWVGACVYWTSPVHTPSNTAPNTLQGGCKGVVRSADDRCLTAVLDDFDDDLWDSQVIAIKIPNEVTYRRLNEALDRLNVFENSPAARVVSCIFGTREPEVAGAVDSVGLRGVHGNRGLAVFFLFFFLFSSLFLGAFSSAVRRPEGGQTCLVQLQPE